MKYDLVTVGHIVLDYVGRKGRVRGPRPGGPCTYTGLAADSLDAKMAAVSKVGPDFGRKRLSWLQSHGVSTSHIQIASSSTTCFRINYRNGSRNMTVTSICDPMNSKDLSDFPVSSAIHIGPVLREISPTLAIRLTSGNSLVGLDPQGYLRQLDSRGRVHVRNWIDRSLLKRIAVLKVSESELSAIIGIKGSIRKLSALGPDIVLLTKGPRGMIVWSRENGMFSVPAYETPVRDPTGAGDALAGSFLVTWVRTNDLLWSVAVGSAMASVVVAKTGLTHLGSRRQIERRATEILGQTIRI